MVKEEIRINYNDKKRGGDMLKLGILLSFVFILLGCTGSHESSGVTNMIEELTGIYMTDEVTPENEKEFQRVPFEKAVNRAFQDNLSGRLRFVAKYKGTAPNAKIVSANHVNLFLCDTDRSDVCSDMIIMPERKSEVVFTFNDNQIVDVFGVISKSSGMKIGGTSVSHSQVGGLGVVTFFKVFGIRPIELNKSISAGDNLPNIYAVQNKLKTLGYNPGKVDGIWGAQTSYAIRQFQKNKGLIETGELDPETISALGL